MGVSEEEHVAYVLDAMVEIHGEVAREEYTGKYRRKCWLLEEVGGWAHPSVGQHQLYMPEYFKTHSNVGFCLQVVGGGDEMLTGVLDDFCGGTYVVYARVDCIGVGVGDSRGSAVVAW